MSTDEAVTKDLIETLEDGKEGFATGAKKLTNDGNPELAATFTRLSQQRAQFSSELRAMASAYGDKIEESGSLAGKLHRGWMSLKDALSGSDPEGVLDAANQGEDHAVSEYEKALEEDISADLRAVVARQSAAVAAARDEVRGLRIRRGLTFALGIRVRAGLVAFADTKIVRGTETGRKSKLTVMHHAGRTIFVMTSGLRSLRDKVVTRLEDDLAARPAPYARLHEFASAYGAQVQRARLEDGNTLREAGLSFDTHAIIGGQLAGDAMPELFHVYPEGNWVLATEDAPYFVVGRSAYGRSILDPLLTYDSDLEAAATIAYLSFEATRSSATDVDYPFDLIVAGDARQPFRLQRYRAPDLDLADLYWRERLRAAVSAFPMRWQRPT